jgi:hypothetical protein
MNKRVIAVEQMNEDGTDWFLSAILIIPENAGRKKEDEDRLIGDYIAHNYKDGQWYDVKDYRRLVYCKEGEFTEIGEL